MKTNTIDTKKYIIDTFPVGVLQCNCTIIGDSVSKLALFVDPVGDADFLIGKLNKSSLQCICIIHTPTHFDHLLSALEIT